MELVTYSVDVGSTNSDSFGWARLVQHREKYEAKTGNDIGELIKEINGDLSEKRHLTLGLECPLYMPIPFSSDQQDDSHEGLSKGRKNEGSRSCFAPAGGYVGFLGLQQTAYLLQNIQTDMSEISLYWKSKPDFTSTDVFLWEAFVSKEAHTDDDKHVDDALTAAYEFMERFKVGEDVNSDLGNDEGTQPLSLAGTAMLWNEPSLDPDILNQKALVIRPDDPYEEGSINFAEKD